MNKELTTFKVLERKCSWNLLYNVRINFCNGIYSIIRISSGTSCLPFWIKKKHRSLSWCTRWFRFTVHWLRPVFLDIVAVRSFRLLSCLKSPLLRPVFALTAANWRSQRNAAAILITSAYSSSTVQNTFFGFQHCVDVGQPNISEEYCHG
jgi:hypothetical protein